MPHSPEKLPPIDAHRSQASPARKLTKEEREQLGRRLCDESLRHKTDAVARAEQKIYKTAERKVISEDEVRRSAVRQVDEELERRRKGRVALEAKHHPPAPKKTLSPEEVQDSVRRVYDEQVRIKRERLQKAREAAERRDRGLRGCGAAGHGDGDGAKKLSAAEASELGARLCKPSKRHYTEEEINAIMLR